MVTGFADVEVEAYTARDVVVAATLPVSVTSIPASGLAKVTLQ